GIRMPKLYAVDDNNEIILKQYIEGPTAMTLIKNDNLPLDAISQIKEMCNLLYPKKLNIDYFPTNFVLQDGLFYYVDYECNEYMDEWNFENWGVKYWSKTPEFLEYLKKSPT
ncbi:MAG: hypothetical protein ACI4V7_08635, partial [Succinivibrionaceae bacterium]